MTKEPKRPKMDPAVVRLRELAEGAGLSARRLAVRMGVHYNSVGNWYKGRRPLPSHEHLIDQAIIDLEDEIRVRSGEEPIQAAWTGRGSEPTSEETALDENLHKVLSELMTKSDPANRAVVIQHWGSFREIAWQLKKRGIKLVL
jgi:transcriptional regulator with XRE-family HTH domain